jgi:large subunit ribosomal protein L4
MTAVDIRTPAGKASGTVDLPAEIFDVQVNVPLIHQVVVAQLAAARQGSAKTKTRAEVSGGGRKPYKQKGTGRARQGSIRAPQYTGGGVVHGPTPRDYSQRTPKKMKAAALRGALSDRAREGRIHVISELVAGDKPSTKSALSAIDSLGLEGHLLVVLTVDETNSWLSLRNAPEVHVIEPGQLNTYDVLVSDNVLFSSAALAEFVAGTPKGKSVKAVATESEAAE